MRVCLVCGDKLSNASTVQNKLLCHFSTKHSHATEKTENYFKDTLRNQSKQSATFTKKFKTSNFRNVSEIMAEKKKKTLPHSFGEKTIIPAPCVTVKTMFDTEYKSKIKDIPLADITVE
ncbi:hypothetical protein PR048_030098 [Dryococelus australis]|uniref:Uncharacterized protein n=1 Tax=Dryococelus australis TaxID=614101 RepID=A0ABQ9G7Z8_9NEOP|nr:hypothetical protein PR048_030098 [Dryococelus australis]